MGDDPGKEETIRVVDGAMRLNVPGEDNMRDGCAPEGRQDAYTARHGTLMGPGDQITLPPGTKHWFQAGNDGVVMYSFSTVARDVLDGFTDPHVERMTKVIDC